MNWSFDRASPSSVAACPTEDEAPAKSCCEHGEGAESGPEPLDVRAAVGK